MTTLRGEDLAEFSTIVQSRVGVPCIYSVGEQALLHARVKTAAATETGLRVTIENLRTPGFVREPAIPDADTFELTAGWGAISFGEVGWTAHAAGWALLFLPELLEAMLPEAERVKDKPQDQRWSALRRARKLVLGA